MAHWAIPLTLPKGLYEWNLNMYDLLTEFPLTWKHFFLFWLLNPKQKKEMFRLYTPKDLLYVSGTPVVTDSRVHSIQPGTRTKLLEFPIHIKKPAVTHLTDNWNRNVGWVKPLQRLILQICSNIPHSYIFQWFQVWTIPRRMLSSVVFTKASDGVTLPR